MYRLRVIIFKGLILQEFSHFFQLRRLTYVDDQLATAGVVIKIENVFRIGLVSIIYIGLIMYFLS